MIYLHEYNVTPDTNKRNELVIKIDNDAIIYDGINKSSEELLDQVKQLLNSHKDALLQSKNIKCSNHKGGRQQQLTIRYDKICDNPIVLIGNTDNAEIATLYNELKDQLISILNNYLR